MSILPRVPNYQMWHWLDRPHRLPTRKVASKHDSASTEGSYPSINPRVRWDTSGLSPTSGSRTTRQDSYTTNTTTTLRSVSARRAPEHRLARQPSPKAAGKRPNYFCWEPPYLCWLSLVLGTGLPRSTWCNWSDFIAHKEVRFTQRDYLTWEIGSYPWWLSQILKTIT